MLRQTYIKRIFSIYLVSFVYSFYLLTVRPESSPVRVKCETTKGSILIAVYKEWAPIGCINKLKLLIDLYN